MVNLLSNKCGKIDPLSVKDYKEYDGFEGLQKVLFKMTPEEVVDEVSKSNLKGRGGAAFPAGLKWRFVAAENNENKYVICNADEGEPGTFKDKVLLNGCPYQVIEGMIIAAYAVGANKGYIYIRGEYPKTKDILIKAVDTLREEGYLGDSILGTDFNFDIEIRSGAGAYVCGEETALIESIEGKPGRSRVKPPYTAIEGLWGKPTLVNNVETFANILPIISLGAEEFKKYGTESSSGTKLISVSGSVANKGVFEIEFGITLREVINNVCGGMENNKNIKFVQLGGSSGAVVPEYMLDVKMDFDELRNVGLSLGSGAIFVADESVCTLDFIKATMEFFKHESCGKCTPCREGNRHIVRTIDRIVEGNGTLRDLDLLDNIAENMMETSLCGLGQAAPCPLRSTLDHFKKEYEDHVNGHCRAGVCSLKGEAIVNG